MAYSEPTHSMKGYIVNYDNVKAAGIVAVMGVVSSFAISNSIRVHREEAAKRKKIREERDLNLAAIARAEKVLRDNINNHVYSKSTSIAQIIQDHADEVEFQKIAVRYGK